MKLRYYMRGLSLGIIVTVVVMWVAIAGRQQQLTDEQVKERAKALGMIESTVLSEAQAGTGDTETDQTGADNVEQESGETDPAEETIGADPVEKIDETAEETPAKVSENTTADETDAAEAVSGNVIKDEGDRTADNSDSIVVVVKSGDSSYTICKRLEEAGVIESAADYDTYLCNNGYSKKICVGTHVVPLDATAEEIAKIITSN